MMTQEIPPEQMVCACHGRSLLECPILNPPMPPQIETEEDGRVVSVTSSIDPKEINRLAKKMREANPITPSPEETMTKPKKAKNAKGATAEAPKIHRRVLVKRVRLGISPEEKDKATTELLAKLKSEETLDAERKETNSAYRDQLKGLQVDIIELREQITRGQLADAEVEEIKDFNKRTVTYKLTENGQIVESRDMTEEDDQLELGGPIPEDDPDNQDQEED